MKKKQSDNKVETNQEFQLEEYLTTGVENIVKGALKASLSNPRESLFMGKYALQSRKSTQLRRTAEAAGEHIPPFLIASITSRCNLHCTGCYARANEACHDKEEKHSLNAREWKTLFKEAGEIGVGFVLLAGGEPLLRRDVIDAAGEIPELLFPIFTNGTLIDSAYIQRFNRCRNLVPILSIEGREHTTDDRRGAGVYQQLLQSMELLSSKGILFGTSITVTTENLEEVASRDFVDKLYHRGCKVIIFVEYVPVSEQQLELAPGEVDRAILDQNLAELRSTREDMLFISFPGDEKSSGGCLAAGRGFFHINARGGAEPCPFSPYSSVNVRDTSLKHAIQSKFFETLRDEKVLMEEHRGGCVLFEKRELVEQLLKKSLEQTSPRIL